MNPIWARYILHSHPVGVQYLIFLLNSSKLFAFFISYGIFPHIFPHIFGPIFLVP